MDFEDARPDVVVQVLERALLDRFEIVAVDLAHLFEDVRQLGPAHAAAGDHRALAVVAHLCTISDDLDLDAH